MAFDLDLLQKLVARHGTVARVVIVEAQGSTPRDVGTVMHVWDSGQEGTIGGGSLEFDATQKAREHMSAGGERLLVYPLGPALGQCCGGFVKLWMEIYDAARLNTLPQTYRAVIRCFDPQKAPDASLRHIMPSLPLAKRAPHDSITHQGWIIEPFSTPKNPLWIWGAGHVGRALVDVLGPLPDFEITWIDTAKERFPDRICDDIAVVYAQNPARLMRHAPQEARHLVLTYSHTLDLELCHQGLLHEFASLGLIGSDTKWAKFRKRLSALGNSPKDIHRITCPIGAPSYGKHPHQIAIGVAAEILTLKNQLMA